MKKILFVINTLGRAGAERAMIELLRNIDKDQYDISLYVLTGQGGMVSSLPEYVHLLNQQFDDSSVFDKAGKRKLKKTVMKAMFRRGTVLRLFPYLVKNFFAMLGRKKVLLDKLLWRVLANGADRFEDEYDLAVAYLEGGATYYVSDFVKAKKKVAFLHVNYKEAGYTRSLDGSSYLKLDRIFTVSDEVKHSLLEAYPECEKKIDIFHNILDVNRIMKRAEETVGFSDDYQGKRLLTIGRLTSQKALDVSIDAMKLLKDAGEHVRWYVLGDGDRRRKLQDRINKLGLQEDFVLLGLVENPYPYIKQSNIYVHCSKFEGKSIAVQEAQVLGKPIIVSDCSGNREQVIDGEDGCLCELSPQAICKSIQNLLHDEAKMAAYGEKAVEKNKDAEAEVYKLLALLEG